MRTLLVLLLLALICASAAGSVLIPTVYNPGFEEETAGWGWQVFNGARVSFEIDKTDPHAGKRCVTFRNESGMSPHVYGRFSATVGVVPSTKYELSCWVRAEDASPEPASFHMTDWSSYTLNFPSGTYDWQKVSVEFTTHPGQHSVNLGINIGNKCKALAVDDVSLRPLGGQIEADGITGLILTEPRVIGQDSDVQVYILIEASSGKAAAVEAKVTMGDKEIAARRSPIRRGENRIEWSWNTGKHPFGTYTCLARVLDARGNVIASGSAATEVADSPVFKEIDRIVERKKEFDKLYGECRARGIHMDYPAAARSMLEQFIPLAVDDVRHGLEYRARYAITDFDRALDEGIATLKAYLSDPALAPVTKRYQTGGVEIAGLSFIGDLLYSDGRRDTGPVFFCGLGHFGQVRKDIPRFPDYGVNIIQIEVGPSATFPAENKVDLTALKGVAKVLDDAAAHNIMVNVLLSPHYFPAWAMKKWPHLGKGGGGFLGYCVDEAEAKQVIERFLRIAVPMLKDKPALHSFCLSNEPVFPNTTSCENTRQLWTEYLVRVHGDVTTLNSRYGTSYSSFDEVPYGGDPQAYDWIVFGQERFAGWHRWMADVIHEMAPDVPTHAKVMSNQMNAGQVNWATDQELFGNLLEINGNDCYSFPTGNPDWPMDPWMLNTSYDIQRSFARKPVFNSENHITPDGSTYYIAPEHFRASLWQGAIHGQGATTIWVWERDYDNKWGFLGNVMDRPGCAQAVGTTCLDLNRFAEEVTALETARARVAVLYSMSSIIRHGAHAGAVLRVYQTLNFCGVKIDFISEKQLATGKGADYRVLIIPEAETVTDAAFKAIADLPAATRVVLLNECFTRNEYGRPGDAAAVQALKDRAVSIADGDHERVLWPALRSQLDLAAVTSAYAVVDAGTGKPIWGVEWLPVKVGGRTVINIINLRGTTYNVKILRDGKEVEARDLLSLGGREKVSALKTLTPVLAEVP